MNLKELKKKYEEMRKEIEKLEKENNYVMKLEVVFNNLIIKVNQIIIGYIDIFGKCNILNDVNSVKVYEEWREYGCIINQNSVQCRNGEYKLILNMIGEVCLERIDIKYGRIYNFEDCMPCAGCRDENIQRFNHNDRPIIF